MLYSSDQLWTQNRRARRFAEAKQRRKLSSARKSMRRFKNFIMLSKTVKWRKAPLNHRRAPHQDRARATMLDTTFTDEEIKARPDPVRLEREEIEGEKIWEETRRCAPAWKAEGAGTVVMKWLEEGTRAEWTAGPPPHFRRTSPPKSLAKRKFLQKERDRWIEIGAAKAAVELDYVSACHLVPKPGKGKFRIVIDYRFINSYMVEKGCRYETLKVLRRMARRGDYFMSVDLKDGYFAVGIREKDQKYFTVDLGELLPGDLGPRYITPTALTFGWSHSPYIFTKVMRVLVGALRARGVRVLPYLDDFLLISEDHSRALRDRQILDDLLHNLGLRRNTKKGQWEPAQTVDHLGLRVDSQRGLFMVPPEKAKKIKQGATDIICRGKRNSRWIASRALASFCGKVLAVHLACPLARYRTRALFDCLSERSGWSGSVKLSAAAISDLRWWATFGSHDVERSLWVPATSMEMHTDAADDDWGAWLDNLVPARGFFTTEERSRHITLKELMAVRLAVTSYGERLRNKEVLHWEDNQAVVFIIRNMVSKSPAMMRELRLLQSELARLDCNLQTRYIPSAENPADNMTRWSDRSDWKLNPVLYEEAVARWTARPTIDRFATATNKQTDRFCSEHLCPGSLGDAWVVPWSGELNWINPPWVDLPRVLQQLRESGASAYLVAPYWESQSWWPDLLELKTDAFVITPADDNYLPGHLGSAEAMKSPFWRTIVCKIN